jgi:hypothetical protein
MTLTSKKRARPTTRAPQKDADPLGFAAKLADAYQEWLRSLLRDCLLVSLKPPVLRRIADVGTAQGEPVTIPLAITVHPRDASGFALVVGELDTFYLPLDYSSDPSLTSLFTEKPVQPRSDPSPSGREGIAGGSCAPGRDQPVHSSPSETAEVI